MAEAKLSAVVETKGAAKAERELTKIAKTAKVVDINTGKAGKSIKSFGTNAAKAVAAIDGPLGGISSRISAITSLASGGAVVFAGFAAAITGASFALIKGVSSLDEYNVNLKRVEATIKATGAGVGFTSKELQATAEQLAIATLTSVDAVQKAQAKLLTFNRVLGDEFTRSIELSQDLAEAGFGSIESNAILLGKALQDPIKGMSALSRVGVTLTETQKELARNAVSTGDVFKAQGVILDAVAGQVKGVGAAVAANTLAGELDSAGIAFDRLARAATESTGALSTWQQIVKGAGVAFNGLASAIEGPDLASLQSEFLESSFALAEAQSNLNEITNTTSRRYRRQAITVENLQVKNDELRESVTKLIDVQNSQIRASGEAAKKEVEARKSIAEQVREEGKAAKDVEDDKLRKKQEVAQKEIQLLSALNATKLEQINTQEQQRLEKLRSIDATFIEDKAAFELAKTEIELNAQMQRDALAQENLSKSRERYEEENALAISLGENISKSLSDGFVDAALSGKNFGEVMKSTVQSVSASILKSGLDQVIQTQIIDKVVGKAFLASKAAETSATVAQAGLNTFASISAIPVVGPAAAPGAVASAISTATSLAAPVLSAAAAREQGGQILSGQSTLVGERGPEIITTNKNARVMNANQTSGVLNSGGSPQVSLVVIDQSGGQKDFQQETQDDGRIVLLIRNTFADDAANANSQISKSISNNLEVERRR